MAVARGDVTLAHISETMSRGQAERLAPMVREAMCAASAAFAEIDRVAVTTGPGSFTGVRVGLSFARALALALDKSCIGVSTLEALALAQSETGLRAALIETPGAAYVALYEDGAQLVAPQAIERGAHVAALSADGRAYTLSGPGVTPDVAALARRAARLDPERYAPAPLYLRAPHVTLAEGGQ